MDLELVGLFAFVFFMACILAVVVWEAQAMKTPMVYDHHHHGPEESRYERAGKTVTVHRCTQCDLIFSAEQP